MRRCLALAVVAGALAAEQVSAATIDQYLGRTLVEVRVEVRGEPLSDAAVLDLIETRVGETLSMLAVRDTIDHLVGLGRFEDIRVFASPADRGVALRWSLNPVRRIGSVSTSGDVALRDEAIRRELDERFGKAPLVARVAEMVQALQAFYAERGYRRAVIEPRVVDGPTPERVVLSLAIVAGWRTTIGAVTLRGAPPRPGDDPLRRLGLDPGRPYDLPAINARIAQYEEDLRGRGYYEARVRQSSMLAADERTTAVTVDIAPGPQVRVVFTGDPLPDAERLALGPIGQERSIDEDLVEDISRNIVSLLRRQGYRSASSTYTRQYTGTELVLTFNVSRGPLHRVGAVEIAGESGLNSGDIFPLLQLATGEPFVEASVAAAAGAITELYRVRGFLQAAVKPGVQVLPSETRAGISFRPVDVRLEIVEGPQTTVDAVEIDGASVMSRAQLRDVLALAPGRPFYRPQLAADRDAIERAYGSRGYQTAAATSQLAFGDGGRRVSITWLIREGPQIQVDRILITGNVRTNLAIIRREITLQPGSPMTGDDLVESQRRLAALGLFRRVRISELPRSGATTRDVLVEVEEADATTISYGGGFEVSRRLRTNADGSATENLDVAPRGFFDISRRNFWGKNRSVTLFARVTLKARDPAADNPDPGDMGGYGLNDYRGLFSFREPRVFGSPGDAQLSAFVEQGVRTSFSFNRRGVGADWARRIGAVTVTGRYTFDYTTLFDAQIAPEDQLLIDRLFPQVKLSKFFGAVLRDSRVDTLDPQQGTVLGLDGSVAARALGSEVGFLKTFMQAFAYRRLPGRGVVLAAGARLGLAVGGVNAVDAIKDLPASERFFAGGDTTVRGFSLDRLGTPETLDPQGFPQGGNGLVVFNVEARAPYWKSIQPVIFVDAGNVFRFAGDIRLSQLRAASGLGVRYRSPIGPLRIDWGIKLGTQLLATGGRERSNVFHISLGQAF